MKVIAIDDEKIALENVVSILNKINPDFNLHGFNNPEEGIEYVKENGCDVAFLDIEMREMDGITVAKQMKVMCPDVNIIFTTGYSEYAGKAFELHASGYINKPVTLEKVQYELQELRNSVDWMKTEKKLTVQTFGNFEVFYDGKPLVFKYNKTKELFAYLIDRKGALCTNKEIMCALWEDDNHISYLKNNRADLLSVLTSIGCENVLERQWGKIGVNTEHLECDFYNWIEGKLTSINAYHGEYMSQYSWAEITHGTLEKV